jgi:hypothetical protein
MIEWNKNDQIKLKGIKLSFKNDEVEPGMMKLNPK